MLLWGGRTAALQQGRAAILPLGHGPSGWVSACLINQNVKEAFKMSLFLQLTLGNKGLLSSNSMFTCSHLA